MILAKCVHVCQKLQGRIIESKTNNVAEGATCRQRHFHVISSGVFEVLTVSTWGRAISVSPPLSASSLLAGFVSLPSGAKHSTGCTSSGHFTATSQRPADCGARAVTGSSGIESKSEVKNRTQGFIFEFVCILICFSMTCFFHRVTYLLSLFWHVGVCLWMLKC